MIRKTLIIGMIINLMTYACTSQQTPTISPLEIQQTAEVAASTMIAQTQAANPTATPLLPTETADPTALPTDTLVPSPTLDGSLPTFTATVAPQASAPAQQDCNKVLSSWQGPSSKLLISYEYTPRAKNDSVVLSLWVTTDLGECGFIPVYGASTTGPTGQYSASAFVDGKKDFKVFGGFRISGGSWTIIIRNESIVAKGGCYPNC